MAKEGGGMFPWRFQKIFRGPSAPHRPRESLPAPPKGMEWVQNDETTEWRLVKAAEPELVTEKLAAAESVPVTPNKSTVAAKTVIGGDQPPHNRCEVDRLPPRCLHDSNKEEDWELLSDRISSSSNQTPGVIIQRGSIRSIASIEEGAAAGSSNNSATLSIPFKIQRTASSSTIDSQDGALGPLGKGVLGVDYVEHVVMPSDTLQGICLSYKIGSTKLRQANHFSGNSLLLAPKKLVIPISKNALRSGFIRVQDTDAKEYKLHAFLAEFPNMSMTECKAYLELADWVLKDAVRSAQDDGEWEHDLDNCSLRSGEIRITPRLSKGVTVGFATQGAGIQPRAGESSAGSKATSSSQRTKVTAHKDIPAIATKTVKAQDIYSAAPQHNNFGVELQTVKKEKDMSGMRS